MFGALKPGFRSFS